MCTEADRSGVAIPKSVERVIGTGSIVITRDESDRVRGWPAGRLQELVKDWVSVLVRVLSLECPEIAGPSCGRNRACAHSSVLPGPSFLFGSVVFSDGR